MTVKREGVIMRPEPGLDPNNLVRAAVGGDPKALDQLMAYLRDDIYRLALRVLGHPADAEDAAQEVLIQILTALATFRAEASVRTWAFRIAIRHYMRFRKGRYESQIEDFGSIDQVINAYQQVPAAALSADETAVYAEEVKWTCLSAILLALTRDERVAYALVELFGLSSAEAAEVLEVDAATLRKRLQRARDALTGYMTKTCGLVNEQAACRCERQVPVHIHFDFVGPEKLAFSRHPARQPAKSLDRARLMGLVETERVAEVFRSHPDYSAPLALLERMRAFIAQGGLQALE
jgi:RNA polymerase sigma factor (sigma-70 family)